MNRGRIIAVVCVVALLAGVYWWMTPRGSSTSAPAVGAAPAAEGTGDTPVAFGVLPTVDDRFVGEPCNLVPGGGLSTLSDFIKEIEKEFPGAVSLSMGDLTQAYGPVGRETAAFHYAEVVPPPAPAMAYVAAGEGELGLGVDFIRDRLTQIQGVTFVCANAADAGGKSIMRGWVLLKSGDRGILVVAVASESLQEEIARRGSDVRLVSATEALAAARAEGLEHARLTGVRVGISVLLVHGDEDEAAALLAKQPGFTFAAAAHGPTMPTDEPRRADGVPILYGGRGARFGWRMMFPGRGLPPSASMTRFGILRMQRAGPALEALKFFRDDTARKAYDDALKPVDARPADPRGAYVGANRCSDCHIAVATQHAGSRHGLPSRSLLDGTFAASTECLSCHVTAPYRLGGWAGQADRGPFSGVSCEACHGPGGAHATAPAKGWGKVAWTRCLECHAPDRTPNFDPETIWKRLGHAVK